MRSNSFPAGVNNAIWFQLFNAVSYQIFLGAPMILYAKGLGASATVLGIITALTPLLTVFQIPAAHYLQRFGYRRFFLAGWGMRNLCVFAVATVPLLGFLGNGMKLVLVIGCLFVFNLLRGIASGAWLPWITELVPETIRAHYLSREQRLIQTGCLLSLLFSGLVLQKNSTNLEFFIVFLVSAIGGAASLFLLNRIPDVHAQRLKLSVTRVPWRAIVTFDPFARLVGFNLLYLFAIGSTGVFVVSFLKGRAGFGENQILLCNAGGFVAGLASLPMAGRLLDRMGSKRLLRWALLLILLCLAWWESLAAGLLPMTIGAVVTAFVLGGIGGSAVTVANVRLQMNTMPVMGRSHFFAFFTVITSLCLGLTPILWGVCLDAMSGLNHVSGPFVWNRYSVYFLALMAFIFVTLLATSGLRESAKLTAEAPEPVRREP